MGCCVSSKIQNEDVVGQCEARKSFVKQAVVARTALACSHARYVQALAAMSLAFKQFSDSELGFRSSDREAPIPPPTAKSTAHKEEDPEEEQEESPISISLSPSPSEEIEERSSRIKAMMLRNTPTEAVTVVLSPPRRRNFTSENDYFAQFGEEERGGEEEEKNVAGAPAAPRIEEIFEPEDDDASTSGSSSDGASSRSGGGGDAGDGDGEVQEKENAAAGESIGSTEKSETPAPVELVDVLRELEEQFLRASEAGKPVVRMLEAGKVQLEKGFSDHSSRLLSALSLGHWSPRSLSSPSGFDIEAGGMSGSHAGTLDRLYAWEKKLYEEVKAWEAVNTELERKRRLLRNLDARGAKPDVIDKTRASMKALETEITVAVHAMEASSANIQKITDEEMLPQLLELLEGLAVMWKNMHECHQQQLRVVMHLKLPRESSLEAISVSHRNTTAQLELALTAWQTGLGSFIATQKDYVRSLSGWIKSSLPPDSHPKKSGKKAAVVPKIRHMSDKWAEALEKLPLQAVSSRMKQLSETLREIGTKQAEEIRLQRRTEALSKELSKKMISLKSLEKKQQQQQQQQMDGSVGKKKSSVDKLGERVEIEKQRFRGAIQDTRSFTLCGLQSSLPPLFQELQSFTEKCMEIHTALYEEVNSYTAGVTVDHSR
ncbi:nitrate regulatory gene2 protein [Selaginella moellendorffii]|nr:nitrate regulatory gene2 protein [Selaginella moellendorffii]|eukprot:XP_002963684.2 nitrate regulatory gene2 protein [Selaginella moellendorffii]